MPINELAKAYKNSKEFRGIIITMNLSGVDDSVVLVNGGVMTVNLYKISQQLIVYQ